jgi:Coenzyme PQQ synthesis protein D (PqqD)
MLKINCMSSVRAFVPRPKSCGVASQKMDGELLLYAEHTHQASCLNASAARIWELCDGDRTVEEIATRAKVDPDIVAHAVKQLSAAGLLENSVSSFVAVDLSRRRTLVGVGLAAIPIILLVTAPSARAASSPCTPSMDTCNPELPPCCTGSCTGGVCV